MTDATALLDSIDWRAESDAYGDASELPHLIRAVLQGEKGALDSLDNRVNHQGTPSPVAVRVVEVISPSLGSPDVPRAPLLVWLGELAAGGDHTRLLARVASGGPRLSPSDSLRGRLRAAVVEHASSAIEQSLTAAAAQERSAAAFAATFVDLPLDTIAAATARETDQVARATQRLALDLGARLREEPRPPVVEADTSALEALVGLVGKALSSPDDVGDDETLELLEGVEAPPKAPGFPFASGSIEALATLAVAIVAGRRKEVEPLAMLLELGRGRPTQGVVAARMLDAVFPDDPDRPRVARSLSAAQRGALEALVDAGLTQPMHAALAAHGLPNGDVNLERFLGRREPGPLDEMQDDEPLWLILQQRLQDERPRSEWLSALEGRDVEAICDDAATAPYNLHHPYPRVLHPTTADHRRWLGRLHEELVATLEACARPKAVRERLDGLLEEERPSVHRVAMWVAAAWAHHVLAGSHRRLFPIAMREPAYAASMRRVLASLPLDERRSLVGELRFRHGRDWCADAWLYMDVMPADEGLERTLDAIRQGKLPLPTERAVAILASWGSDALPKLEEALDDLDGPRQEIVAEACVLIRSQK